MDRNGINSRLKRTNIKGREYIEVNQRILAFWELYPGGRIVTEKVSDDGSRCDFVARVYDGDMLLATGHSFEFQSAGMVNKTSYVENCETSAVGRALGILGIGITESIASADEVQAAIEHQERREEPQKQQKQQPKQQPKRRAASNPLMADDADPALYAAQMRLKEAVDRFCEAGGIEDSGKFLHEKVYTLPEYANNVDALDGITKRVEAKTREKTAKGGDGR